MMRSRKDNKIEGLKDGKSEAQQGKMKEKHKGGKLKEAFIVTKWGLDTAIRMLYSSCIIVTNEL